MLNRFDEAIEVYHHALSYQPDFPFATEMLTMALNDSMLYVSAAKNVRNPAVPTGDANANNSLLSRGSSGSRSGSEVEYFAGVLSGNNSSSNSRNNSIVYADVHNTNTSSTNNTSGLLNDKNDNNSQVFIQATNIWQSMNSSSGHLNSTHVSSSGANSQHPQEMSLDLDYYESD